MERGKERDPACDRSRGAPAPAPALRRTPTYIHLSLSLSRHVRSEPEKPVESDAGAPQGAVPQF